MEEFWEISFKEWGKSMQDDITDGVQWLINEELQTLIVLPFMELPMVAMQHWQV